MMQNTIMNNNPLLSTDQHLINDDCLGDKLEDYIGLGSGFMFFKIKASLFIAG